MTCDGSGDAEDRGGEGDGGRREIRLTSVLSLKKYIEDNTHMGRWGGGREGGSEWSFIFQVYWCVLPLCGVFEIILYYLCGWV